MTKFILEGGYTDRAADGGLAFAQEFVKGFDQPVKILLCYFARTQDSWKSEFAEDKEFFKKLLPDIEMEFALADPERFRYQLTWANAVCIGGGNMEPLFDSLKQSSGWEKELDGKTVSGSSAGAYALSAYWYDIDDAKSIHEGLGLVPVKCIAHYQSDYNAPNVDWKSVLAQTEAFHPELETVTLREGEFKVFTH
jgi:peptidase E